MKTFLTDDFLLETDTARELYHQHAKDQPIYDYHCHIPPDQIAANHTFKNVAEIWLHGDHYKWRAMRANGIAEKYCTGDASDWEKFLAFAKTVPGDESDAVYFYTRDVPAGEKPCELQARMFHPGASGLCEDPATGSATAAAAALLADLDPMKDGELRLRIGQGVDMGRPSLLLTRVRKQNGAVASTHVGGSCVQMMEGTFRLPGKG